MKIELGPWEDLRELALPVRLAVFVQEQGVPLALELDAWDAPSLHAIARDGRGAVIGTARLLPDGHIGRMAVYAQARGRGVGTALLRRLMEVARTRGLEQVLLSAQVHAVPFYERLGFAVCSAPYPDAGIAHVDMRCTLSHSQTQATDAPTTPSPPTTAHRDS